MKSPSSTKEVKAVPQRKEDKPMVTTDREEKASHMQARQISRPQKGVVEYIHFPSREIMHVRNQYIMHVRNQYIMHVRNRCILSYPEVLPWQSKIVWRLRQSKITMGPIFPSLGGVKAGNFYSTNQTWKKVGSRDPRSWGTFAKLRNILGFLCVL